LRAGWEVIDFGYYLNQVVNACAGDFDSRWCVVLRLMDDVRHAIKRKASPLAARLFYPSIFRIPSGAGIRAKFVGVMRLRSHVRSVRLVVRRNSALDSFISFGKCNPSGTAGNVTRSAAFLRNCADGLRQQGSACGAISFGDG
jgi:hypothetical protein